MDAARPALHHRPDAAHMRGSRPQPAPGIAPHPPSSSHLEGLDAPASLSVDALLALQATAGNDAVASMLQRQVPIPAPASGVTPPPAVATPPKVPVPDFSGSFFYGGPNFDLVYTPTGPLPNVDKLTAILKVHVNFKDFDRTMMRGPDFVGHRWTRARST